MEVGSPWIRRVFVCHVSITNQLGVSIPRNNEPVTSCRRVMSYEKIERKKRELQAKIKKLPSLAEDSTGWQIPCCSLAVAVSCTQIYQCKCGRCGGQWLAVRLAVVFSFQPSLAWFTASCSLTRDITSQCLSPLSYAHGYTVKCNAEG